MQGDMRRINLQLLQREPLTGKLHRLIEHPSFRRGDHCRVHVEREVKAGQLQIRIVAIHNLKAEGQVLRGLRQKDGRVHEINLGLLRQIGNAVIRDVGFQNNRRDRRDAVRLLCLQPIEHVELLVIHDPAGIDLLGDDRTRRIFGKAEEEVREGKRD